MKYNYQTKHGVHKGNCMVACISSLINESIDQVPNIEVLYDLADKPPFKTPVDEVPVWVRVMTDYLVNRGFLWRCDPLFSTFHTDENFKEEKDKKAYALARFQRANLPYIAIGDSQHDVLHACIYVNGHLLFDPSGREEPLKKITSFQSITSIATSIMKQLPMCENVFHKAMSAPFSAEPFKNQEVSRIKDYNVLFRNPDAYLSGSTESIESSNVIFESSQETDMIQLYKKRVK